MRLVNANVARGLIFLLSTGGPAEPLDTSCGTLRLRNPDWKTLLQCIWNL